MKICAVFVLASVSRRAAVCAPRQEGSTTALPVTTSSAKARELYQKGMADYENLYLERCNDDWRAAVKEDPNLAVALGLDRLQQRQSRGSQRGSRQGQGACAQADARRAVDGRLDRQSAGRRLPRRHYRHERHARDVSPRQAPALSRGQLADGRKRQRPGAAHHGEGAGHRQELSRRR